MYARPAQGVRQELRVPSRVCPVVDAVDAALVADGWHRAIGGEKGKATESPQDDHNSVSKIHHNHHLLPAEGRLAATTPNRPGISSLRDRSRMAANCLRAIFVLSFLCGLLVSSSLAVAGYKSGGHCFPAHRLLRSRQRSQEGAAGDHGEPYETRYFTQTLDHFGFRPESYATFRQRYLVNGTHWGGAEAKAPIFVYTGGEADVELIAQNTGFMFDMAPHVKAMLVFIEHRYYGQSNPFGSEYAAHVNASTLGYLSSTQALADFATLIIDLKKNLTAEGSPVVVFGGSYGGMLAAWFRLKYPHVAIGALASSAPILQFDDLVSPYTFNSIITNDFKSESENCYKVIKNSWQEMEDAEKQPGGREKLQKSFKICNNNNVSAHALERWIFTALTYTAMTDYPTPADFLTQLPAYPVRQMCRAIDDQAKGNDTFAKLHAAVNIYYNGTGAKECFDLHTSPSDRVGYGGWLFQACTEMILPTEGNNEGSIFPASTYNYTERAEFCRNKFGIEPRPNWIAMEFGGHHVKRVLKRFGSNIIFFNGLRDPWSGGGVLESLSDSLIAIVAPKGAHHVDLRFSTKEDPKWLTDVRRKEIGIIRKWLHEYYQDLAYI